jgi:hypothetical protein
VIEHHALLVLAIVGGLAAIGFAGWWMRRKHTVSGPLA